MKAEHKFRIVLASICIICGTIALFCGESGPMHGLMIIWFYAFAGWNLLLLNR